MIYVVKIEGLLNKQIQGESRVAWMPEREDGHVLLSTPGLTGLRIGEGPQRQGYLRLKPEISKHGQGPLQIVWFQLDDEVEIESRAKMTVKNYGDSTDDEIANTRLLQRSENPFDASTHDDSVPRRLG